MSCCQDPRRIDPQTKVGAWHRATFSQDCPLSWVSNKLAAETGEVCQAVITLEGEPCREGRIYENLRDEAADVLIVLYALADRAGFDLDQALADRFGVVSQREFTPCVVRRPRAELTQVRVIRFNP